MNITKQIKQIMSQWSSLIKPDCDTVIFDFGEFEVTKREIISSILIVVAWFIIGFIISEAISEQISDKQREYNQALQIETKDLFEYGMKTNVGNAFVYGQLKAVDKVTYPEIKGEYLKVEKILEVYTKHERQVEHTDSKGNKYYTTEEYYTWDEEDWDSKHSEKITFLGVEFDYSKIKYSNMRYIETIYESMSRRWVYYGTAPECNGTIYTKLCDNSITQTSLHPNQDIEQTLESYNNSFGMVAFWILWCILLILGIYGFYYLDNEWLS